MHHTGYIVLCVFFWWSGAQGRVLLSIAGESGGIVPHSVKIYSFLSADASLKDWCFFNSSYGATGEVLHALAKVEFTDSFFCPRNIHATSTWDKCSRGTREQGTEIVCTFLHLSV